MRAGNPRPGAWCVVGGRRVKVWRARGERSAPRRGCGSRARCTKSGALATADGLLELVEVQPEGKRTMTRRGARRGHRADAPPPRSAMTTARSRCPRRARTHRERRVLESRPARRSCAGRGSTRASRAFATDLVYGTVRRRHALDFLITPCSSQALARLEPAVLAALRMGAYQLVDGVPAHAAVGETVDAVATRAPTARGYVIVSVVLTFLVRPTFLMSYNDGI